MISFNAIWDRICKLQNEEFRTITGLVFTYILESGVIWIIRRGHRINQSISIINFSQVYSMMQENQITGPGKINKRAIRRGDSQVRGTSYVWAILHDPRVKP